MGLAPHWPAVYRMRDGTYILTNVLYPTVEVAKQDLGEAFVELAIFYPAINLDTTPPVYKAPPETPKRYQPKGFDFKTGKRK